jgi:tryptophan halogenase
MPWSHTITVVEDPSVPTIGVGESTTGLFTETLVDLGVDFDDFVRVTGATQKFGIRHEGWRAPGAHYYGVLEGSPTVRYSQDLAFAWQQDHSLTHTGWCIDHQLSNTDSTGAWRATGHAWHIDASTTCDYLRTVCTAQGVTYAHGKIVAPCAEGVVCADGSTLHADLVIDCTGLSRVLCASHGWKSSTQYLAVDRAIAFPLENPTPANYTLARAQLAGWRWHTPLLHRSGNGYAYSSAHTTVDEVCRELGGVEPIADVAFTPGRLAYAWQDHVVAIGLSQGFLEPLEGTGLHHVIAHSRWLAEEYIQPTPSATLASANRDSYNQRVADLYDSTRDFVALHYRGSRTDTEFWRTVTHDLAVPDSVQATIEVAQHRLPTWNDFYTRPPQGIGWELYCYVLQGLGLIAPEVLAARSDPQSGPYLQQLEQELATAYQPHEPYAEWYRRNQQTCIALKH